MLNQKLPGGLEQSFPHVGHVVVGHSRGRFQSDIGILKVDPQNTELLLADAELKATEKQSSDVVLGAFARAADTAATPEVFHLEASTALDKGSRPIAIAALERGVQTFPANARLFRRLAYLYIRDNRLDDAVNALRTAMELEPMMPDAYGALGEIFTMRGPEQWGEAIAALEEALRLDPENANHLTRRAALMRLQGIVDAEKRAELWAKAEEDLRKAIQLDTKNDDAHLLLGTLLLDQAGDLDQAEWLVKKALKQTETPEGLVQRARVLIRRAAFQEAEQLLNRAVKRTTTAIPRTPVAASSGARRARSSSPSTRSSRRATRRPRAGRSVRSTRPRCRSWAPSSSPARRPKR
jgi:cytochrome c-type biogenesis protein CcmH/NrfG